MKKAIIVITVILDILAASCLLLAYGPYAGFRDFIITTAMTTKSHRYLARFLYAEETIQEVLSKNSIIEPNENSNEGDIHFNNGEKDVYESVYEEQILKRDPNHPDYKIIEWEGNGYHAYLTVIYDASRVHLVTSEYLGVRGENLSDMAKKSNAIVAINGGGFVDVNEQGDGGQPTGLVIRDGKILNDPQVAGNMIGFTQNNVLVLGKYTAQEAIQKGVRDALEFGPFLIVNGKSSMITGNGGWGNAPRTAIAQRQDGIVLFLTVDGNGVKQGYRGGISMADVTKILLRYRAYNAANLDGGASTGLVVNGEIYNNPVAYSLSGERELPDGWIFK